MKRVYRRYGLLAVKFTLMLPIMMLPTEPASAEGFFESLFGITRAPPSQPSLANPKATRPRPETRIDSSRAPAPRRNDSKEVTTSVVVVADDMAEWLSSGLEEAFSESPQVSVRRRTALDSGLVRYSPQNESAWPQIARDILSRDKADYSVVMIGLSDRQDIQEKTAKEDAQNIPVGETAKTDELTNSKMASVSKETSPARKQTLRRCALRVERADPAHKAFCDSSKEQNDNLVCYLSDQQRR